MTNKLHITILILGLAIVMAMTDVSAQSSDIKVRILNSPPQVLEVTATSVLSPKDSAIVWCTAVCEDLNEFKDVVPLFYIGMPKDDSITNRIDPAMILRKRTSVIRGQGIAGFVITPSAPHGPWQCFLNATDSIGDYDIGKASFRVMPGSCGNDLADSNEKGTDCGGPCVPCSCTNGLTDGSEQGVDCGGECKQCLTKGALTLNILPHAGLGGTILGQVLANGNGTMSLIRVTKPSGELLVLTSDEDGAISLIADQAGIWDMRADLYGMMGASAKIQVGASGGGYDMPDISWVLILVVVIALLVYGIKKLHKGEPKKPERHINLNV